MLRTTYLLAPTLVLAMAALACSKTGQPSSTSEPAATTAALPALEGFEGEIDLAMKADKPPPDNAMSLALLVKGGKLRADLPEQLAKQPGNPFGKAYAIFDAAGKKVQIVVDARKEVILVDLNKTGEQLKGLAPAARDHGAGAPPAAPPKVTKTGKFDEAAGYRCENWDITTDHHAGTVCVAQQGASWFSLPITGIPTEHLWMAELLDGKHFPLRFVGYGKDGAKEEGRVEVTRIDKKALAAADFEPPPGYRVVDLEQMMRGFAMGMAGMPGMPGGMPMRHHPKPQ